MALPVAAPPPPPPRDTRPPPTLCRLPQMGLFGAWEVLAKHLTPIDLIAKVESMPYGSKLMLAGAHGAACGRHALRASSAPRLRRCH